MAETLGKPPLLVFNHRLAREKPWKATPSARLLLLLLSLFALFPGSPL